MEWFVCPQYLVEPQQMEGYFSIQEREFRIQNLWSVMTMV